VKKLRLAAALMLWSATAHAQNQPIFPGPAVSAVIIPSATPLGFQSIALAGTAVGLTVPPGAAYALVAVSGGNAFWRDDGGSPAVGAGMPLVSGAAPVALANLATLKFIAASATLSVSYYQ
jgi:hypothetical protein